MFEEFDEQCKSNVLAVGQTAVILNTPGKTGTVIKFQTGPDGEITALQSVSPYEVDICRLLWLALAPSGLSRHVCRAIGATTVVNGGKTKTGLEMERLCGNGKALNLEEFILNAASDGDGDGGETFGNTLRALIFQALYTLSMCTFAFNGLFRHNDLHARNVCFSPWNGAGLPVETGYTLRCFPDSAEGMFVDRCFVLRSVYRAVIIDYGWAVLLPGLGPDFDARFFKAGPKNKRVDVIATVASFKDSGMSQHVPCQSYDAALLMYSIYTASLAALAAAGATSMPANVSRELLAFNAFYDFMYRDVPHTAGRLGLSLQRNLLRARTVPGTTTVVPGTEHLLRSSYFSAFRCTSEFSCSLRYRFGWSASRTVLELELESKSKSDSLKASPCYLAGGKKEWTAAGPSTGPFTELFEKVMQNIRRWKTETAVRGMKPEEEEEWTAVVRDTQGFRAPSPAAALPRYVSPPTDVHLPPTKRICVKSPS